MRAHLTIVLYFCLTYTIFDSGGVLISVRNSEDSLVLLPRDSLDNGIASNFPDGTSRNKRAASGNLELVFFRIQADIRYRYSRTYITSHVVNRDSKKAAEVTFQVVLPETAFISKFAMEIDGKTYEAYVKEKDEAKRVYDQAQSQGQSAGLVALNTRHSNVFNVNVNIKANSIINFNLTYEELLTRRLGRYEQVININGDQIANVQDAEIQVVIEESQPLTLVRVPELRNELEVQDEDETNNKDADIVKPTPNRANITYRPSSSDSKLKNGKMGQFVVQYDIKRESDSGEVLIMNGYFVHFFAPPNLKPLRKHIVFVLDISGSMAGRKIEQLKAAMTKILSDLSKDDYLNIIIFSTDVLSWSPGDTFEPNYQHGRSFPVKPRNRRLNVATSENIAKAKDYISSLQATGSTNIHDALIEALDLTAAVRRPRDESRDDRIRKSSEDVEADKPGRDILPKNVESLIMFLTDGEATVGVTDPTQIQTLIQSSNMKNSIPIFALAFGSGADFPFLRKLSLQNHGFARKIYEAADAELQLQGFYNEIASPLLSNVKFNYTSPEFKYTVSEVTRRRFPTLFGGTEIAVAGKMNQKEGKQDDSTSDTAKMVSTNSFMMPHEPLVRYPPTDDCYFHTHIRGHGHGGRRHWEKPMMYIWRPPWWCHPHPIPTTTTTKRPPPETSLEDTFLERLWAYLTIQQLIEQDYAEGKDQKGRGSKESSKQKALRLALKYGFVTPLTSLVVVKPTSEDVTDARSTDSKPEPFASNSGGGGHHGMSAMRHGKMKTGGFAGPMPMMAFGSAPPVSSLIGSTASQLTPVQNNKASADSAVMDSQDDQGSPVAESSKPRPSKKAQIASTTMKTTMATANNDSSSSKKLGLSDLTWLKEKSVMIKKEEYIVAPEDGKISAGKQQECNIGSGGSPLNRTKGNCRHLKDCVQPEFVDDFSVYEESYFCPIEIRGDSYAGACCTKSKGRSSKLPKNSES